MLLHEATAGNPFFLDEVARLLLAEGRFDDASLAAGGLGVPDRVRSAVRARLAPLSAKTREALAVAATVGEEFDPELLAAVLEETSAQVCTTLGPAVADRFLRALPSGAFRFAHALIREMIYEELTLTARGHLHCRIGSALEVQHARRPDAVLPALAHHFLQGQPEADAGRAVFYARRAGEQAMEHLAYQRAADYFGQALTLLDRGAVSGASERGELQLAVATNERNTRGGARGLI